MKHLKRLGVGLLFIGVLVAAALCCFGFALLWQYAIKTQAPTPYLAGTAAFVFGTYVLGYILIKSYGDES